MELSAPLYIQKRISDHEPPGQWRSGKGRRQDVQTACLLAAQRLGLMCHGLRTINFSKLINLLQSCTKSKRQQSVVIP
jgi:hypothetical protein